jgi:hypothetical protein
MPSLRLTTASVQEVVKPGSSADVLYWDTETKGFGLRVSPKGVARFIAQGRVRSTNTEARITIGTYGAWTVEEARQRANQIRKQFESGIDPREQKGAVEKEELPWSKPASEKNNSPANNTDFVQKLLELVGRADGDLQTVFYELGQAFEMGRQSVK